MVWTVKATYYCPIPFPSPVHSQPKVNGARSDDADVGWGGAGGVVFQKAYVEFFVSPHIFLKLLPVFDRYPSLTYHAVDFSGAYLPVS